MFCWVTAENANALEVVSCGLLWLKLNPERHEEEPGGRNAHLRKAGNVIAQAWRHTHTHTHTHTLTLQYLCLKIIKRFLSKRWRWLMFGTATLQSLWGRLDHWFIIIYYSECLKHTGWPQTTLLNVIHEVVNLHLSHALKFWGKKRDGVGGASIRTPSKNLKATHFYETVLYIFEQMAFSEMLPAINSAVN